MSNTVHKPLRAWDCLWWNFGCSVIYWTWSDIKVLLAATLHFFSGQRGLAVLPIIVGKEHNSPTLFVLIELGSLWVVYSGTMQSKTFLFFGCLCFKNVMFAGSACRAKLSWLWGSSIRRKMHIFSNCLFEGQSSSSNELRRPPAHFETSK